MTCKEFNTVIESDQELEGELFDRCAEHIDQCNDCNRLHDDQVKTLLRAMEKEIEQSTEWMQVFGEMP